MAAEASNHTPTAAHALSDLDCVSHSGTLTGLPGLIGQPVLLERHQGDTAQRQVQPGPVAPTHPRDNFVHRIATKLSCYISKHSVVINNSIGCFCRCAVNNLSRINADWVNSDVGTLNRCAAFYISIADSQFLFKPFSRPWCYSNLI